MNVVFRKNADRELTDSFEHYLVEAGETIAQQFLSEFKLSLATIVEFPASGSPRYLNLIPPHEIRFCRVRRFPYLIFYIVRPDYLEVIAILHAQRDIPSALTDPSDEPPQS